ncbi:MAG TPA: DUF58 domain-containing protein [Methylomirabilota bacterium]|nr:DUF58 domain-containing protein [Methylomirabilota bacterium]
MTARRTGLTVSALSLVALALFLAVLAGRAELLLVALPLLLKLVAGARDPTPPAYDLDYEVSAERVFEGDRLVVTVTLTARSPVPLLELAEPLPSSVEVVSGLNRAVLALEAGQRGRWTYEVRCRERGHFSLGTVHARIWERSGLRVLEGRHLDPKPVRVYPRVVPLRRVPRPLRTQTSVGNYVSPTFGAGLEPGDIRPFAPGDRVKHVNWRASLRLGALYVTQYQQERNADVVLMLDTLSQVGLAPETSLDGCVRAAASLARAYLARKDRVGFIEYGGVIRWVRPGSGPAQLERLLDGLVAAQPLFTYIRKDLSLVPPRVLPPQALVIALSPLLDPRFLDAVGDLAARGFDLVVLSVSPIDLTRAALAPTPLTDLTCRLWALERRAQLAELRRRGLVVLEWAPDAPVELALASLGGHRRRMVVAG